MSEGARGQDVPVDVTMRRRTLVGVPAMPQVGEALEVRRARVEDSRALASLLGSAFEGETWDAAGVERELLCDPTVRAVLGRGGVGDCVRARRWRCVLSRRGRVGCVGLLRIGVGVGKVWLARWSLVCLSWRCRRVV